MEKDATSTIQKLSELHENIRRSESLIADLRSQIAEAQTQEFDAAEIDQAVESASFASTPTRAVDIADSARLR
jgi:uncharacterized membrane protein